MSDEENVLFYAIVHGLRSQGWSRIEAEGEALERIVRRRLSASQGPTDNERD